MINVDINLYIILVLHNVLCINYSFARGPKKMKDVLSSTGRGLSLFVGSRYFETRIFFGCEKGGQGFF